MNLLIVDIETSGLNYQLDSPIECGAILFSVECREILQVCSTLIRASKNDAYHINKISLEALSSQYDPSPCLDLLSNMIMQADFIVSHNKSFDSKWLQTIGIDDMGKKWLCTAVDFSWPSNKGLSQRPQLLSLALAYEIPVWKSHRALNDCLYLAWIFEKEDNLLNLIEDAQIPRTLYVAEVLYEEKDIAKAAGFVWNRFVKNKWGRYLTENEIQKLPFKVTKVLNTGNEFSSQ